ncbi:MAG: DNA topoisomerase, partial [Chitinophagaceae bacterium]
PAAPFTTSTLQQEASRKLGYSVSKTMLIAQKLYESGKITYMRTDSVNLSETAITEISAQIDSQYGKKYFQKRVFQNKNKSAQEAHEAIRPTYIQTSEIEDYETKRLYDMIWKRTMASQMADAELEKTIAKINISTNNEELTAQGEVIKFEGFLKVYREDTDEEDVEDDNSDMLPPLKVNQVLHFNEMRSTEKFSRAAPRYTEASLVKKLEELGIGRPSTYAPTISTIQKRGYVEKRSKEGTPRKFQILLLKDNVVKKETGTENTGVEKNKLFPSDLGLVVTDFLTQHFEDIMDYGFTAKIEEEFDEIAEGHQVWNKMVGDFYIPFKKDVEHTLENAERAKGERELGISPSGKKVIARMGRYGPMIQIGETSAEEKPEFAKLKVGQSIETISLEDAMELFKLPRNIGKFEDEDVIINIGRFGPYASHNKMFYSLQKEMDPYTVLLEEITPLIAEKRTAKEERTIKVFEKAKIQVLKGPYGPYIKQGLRNYKLTKEQQEKAADITLEEAKEIIEHLKANPPKKSYKKKKK